MQGDRELDEALRQAAAGGLIAPALVERLRELLRRAPPGQEQLLLRGAGLSESVVQRLLLGTGLDRSSSRRGPAPEGGPPRGSGDSSAAHPLGAWLRAGGSGSGRLAGTRLGPWWIDGELGRGAMGAVLLARHAETGQQAALKVLLGGADASERRRQRLAREAEALRQLSHPALVRILDAGVQDGLPYLAMDYVPGVTLAERLDRLPLRALVELLAEVSRGLGVAHAAGLVHRDVKPDNILVRNDTGLPVLTDFGLARDLSQDSDLTRSGASVGTPHYMAPEQVTAREPSPASDVFALGVILYQGLTGRLPFPSMTLVELYEQIVQSTPLPPHRVDPQVPRALERLCLQALDKDPARRPPDGAAFARALEDWLGQAATPRRGRRPQVLAGAILTTSAVAAGLLLASGDATPGPAPGAPTASPASPAPQPAGEHVLVLQPGPVEGKDTMVRNDGLYANDNFGAQTYLVLGDRESQRGDLRVLIEFDLSPLPAGTRLEEARLELRQLWTEEHDAALTVVAHRVIPSGARTPWREGTSLRDERIDGVVFDGDLSGHFRGDDPSVRSRRPEFSQPDCAPDADPPRSTLPAGSGSSGWLRLDVTRLVQAWLDGEPNLGLRLSHEPEGPPYLEGMHMFGSAEHPDPEARPRLVLRYVGQPPAPVPNPQDVAAAAAARVLPELQALDVFGIEPARLFQRATAALTEAPHLGQAFALRGLAQVRAADYAAACIDLYNARASAAPDNSPEMLRWFGRALLEQARAREASEQLTEGCRADPKDVEMQALLLFARQEAGQGAPAPEELGVLLALPEPPWAALLLQARALQAGHQLDLALNCAGRACEAEERAGSAGLPRSALPLSVLGDLSCEAGQTSQAEAALSRALELVPGSPVAMAVVRRWSQDGR